MLNRRSFLKTSGLLLAGSAVASSQLLTSCAAGSSKTIGLQLYSLRDDISELGIQEVLKIVSKMGYTNLETAGYSNGMIYGLAPAEFKKIVTDLGMRATSAHLGRAISDNPEADMAWWSEAIDTHNTAGMKYMVMPFSPLKADSTLDQIKAYGEYFYKIGLQAAGANIKFGYHNHDFEFKEVEGKTIYEHLIENTSADHVMFEMDVYWVMRGGQDPVELMKKYPTRFPVLHIKDEKAIGASGKMDFEAIFNQAYTNGLKDWYVEVERYDGTPQEDVKKSFDFLNAAPYVK